MYQIFKGGCESRHPSTFVMSRPRGVPNYVLLIIRTAGKFQIAGQHFSVTPGYALILTPGTPYSYRNPQGDYIDDWLHWDMADSAPLPLNLPPTNLPFPVGRTELFSFLIRQILMEAAYTQPPYAKENIDSLFTVLLNHLQMAFRTQQPSETFPYQSQLQLLRLKLQNSPGENYTIAGCAGEIGISPSYFQHLYTDFFGISFQKDLIHLRMEQAKYYLTTTDLTVEQIAMLSGYSNEVHFYRQFKAMVGSTPAKYRKSAL